MQTIQSPIDQLLEKIKEAVPAVTISQVEDILMAQGTTPDAVLALKDWKFNRFLDLVKSAQPGGLAVADAPIVSTQSKAPQAKAIATQSVPVTEAPIVPAATSSSGFNWDTATDEECDAEDARLAHLEARSLRKANALKRERQIAATNAEIFDDEAQTIDFNQKGLEASQELAKQRAMLAVQAESAPRLLQLQIDTATSIATDRITRTEAAIEAGKSAMQETPLASEIAAFRAKLTQREMMNRATSIGNATPALLGSAQPENVTTIDA